ncbi:hypothetical protein Hanom_Chr12g01168481 [Helianthus anomalus]
MNNFSKYIPFSLHIIHMIILYNSILSHHFHSKYPIPNYTFTLPSNLKHLPKRPFSNHPHNLKIPRPNLTTH